jgi:hypothetical protein
MYKTSSTKLTLLVFLVFFLFTALVLPAQNQKSSQVSGERSPDLSLFYDAAALLQMADSYGPSGRMAYVQARITFDVLWPVVYGVFLCVSLSWVLKRLLPDDHPWRLLNLLPCAAVLFDYLENLSAGVVMQSYPESPLWALYSAPVFTPIKWLFVGGCFVLLCVVLIALGFKSIQKGMDNLKM